MNTQATNKGSYCPPLTFGVEIELLVAVLGPNAQDPHPHDLRHGRAVLSEDPPTDQSVADWLVHSQEMHKETFEHITKTLKAANVPARSADSGEDDFTCWCMADDGSIERPNNKNYSWVRLEVKSPALYMCPAAFEQVAAVVEILTTNYRICSHESAGLHVHVGQENNGFPLSVLRNLMSTIFVFEDRLNVIHPQHRVEENRYARSLRTYSKLADRLSERGESKAQGLQFMLKAGDDDADPSSLSNNAKNRETFLKWMEPNGGDRLAYNLLGLKLNSSSYGNPKATIEFRQHESTADDSRIVHWLKLCVGLVEFAYKVDFRILKPFLEAHIDDEAEDFSLVELLKAVGLPVQMLFYSLLHNDQPSEYYEESEWDSVETDAMPPQSQIKMPDISKTVERIDNRQPVQRPSTLDTDGFEKIEF